jgi:hypothetical protein
MPGPHSPILTLVNGIWDIRAGVLPRIRSNGIQINHEMVYKCPVPQAEDRNPRILTLVNGQRYMALVCTLGQP